MSLRRATLSSLRTCRTVKTVVKCKFLGCPSDPLVTSCVSDRQNCGKMQILRLTLATLSSLRACRILKTVVKRKFFASLIDPSVTSCVLDVQNCGKNDHFGSFFFENCRKHRAKRSFWKLCCMKFGGSLARNDPFKAFSEIWRTPRAKRSFFL